MCASFLGVFPSGTDGGREESCGSLVKVQASAPVDVPTVPAVWTMESNASASFCANAWTRAGQATDRDLESVRAVRKMNAWICALLTTDRDPASVIPDKKRKSVITESFTGPIVF